MRRSKVESQGGSIGRRLTPLCEVVVVAFRQCGQRVGSGSAYLRGGRASAVLSFGDLLQCHRKFWRDDEFFDHTSF